MHTFQRSVRLYLDWLGCPCLRRHAYPRPIPLPSQRELSEANAKPALICINERTPVHLLPCIMFFLSFYLLFFNFFLFVCASFFFFFFICPVFCFVLLHIHIVVVVSAEIALFAFGFGGPMARWRAVWCAPFRAFCRMFRTKHMYFYEFFAGIGGAVFCSSGSFEH